MHSLIGRRVVGGDGRPLGSVIGITHHWDGGASGLLSCRSGLRRDGLEVSLEGATLIDGRVHLRPLRPAMDVPLTRPEGGTT
jgi:hypothetical protein